VIQKGKSDILSAGICYSSTVVEPSLDYGEYVNVIPDASGIISVELSGWKGRTRYYVRAYATNSEGISYGEVMTFETPSVYSNSLAAFDGIARLQGSPAYCSVGNTAYILGGDLGPQCTYELWSYIALENRWLQLLPFPKGVVKWQAAVSYNTDVYVLGGIGSESEKRNDFSRYDSPRNMWFSMPVGPDSSYLRAGFLLGTEICFVGGMKDTAKNEVWAYEVGLGAWSQKVDFPIRQYGGIAVNINDTVYAGLGKSTTGICNRTLWKSSATLTTWTQEPLCTAINGGILAGVAYKNKIYVIDEAYYIFEYNPSVQQWTTKSRLPASHQNIHCMYVLNDMIYIGLGMNALITYNPLWDN
jgi:N-acetylneuraminic acid mutarotase